MKLDELRTLIVAIDTSTDMLSCAVAWWTPEVLSLIHIWRSRRVTDGGLLGSENAGMSGERRESNSSAVNPRFPGRG